MDPNVDRGSWSTAALVIAGIAIVIFREQVPVLMNLVFKTFTDLITNINFG